MCAEFPKAKSIILDIHDIGGIPLEERLTEFMPLSRVLDFIPQYLDLEEEGENFLRLANWRGIPGACKGYWVKFSFEKYEENRPPLEHECEWLLGRFGSVLEEHRKDGTKSVLATHLERIDNELPQIPLAELGLFGQWLNLSGYEIDFGKEILKEYWRA